MKKALIGLVALVLVTSGAWADSYTYTVSATNGVTTTNNVVASGWLDKIEVSQSATHTATVVVATYDDLDTAVDTFASLSSVTAQSTVVRPGFVRTTSAGVALTAVPISGVITNGAGTILSAIYDRPMIGGKCQIKVTGGGGTSSALNNVKVVVYYEPLKK